MFKNSIISMTMIFLSRILGFLRGFVVAYYFGAGTVTDAYFSAFKISNFFRQLLGEGALGNSFIPVYNEKSSIEGRDKSNNLIFSILNIIGIFSIIVTVIMILFAKPIMSFVAMGFGAATKLEAASLLQIMAVYFVFISLSGMICAILQNFGHFAITNATSMFFNIAIILAGVFFSRTYGIKALAIGVVLGGLLQLLVVLPHFFKEVRGYSFHINIHDKYLHRVFLMMGTMLIGIAARQINTIVDQMFASSLEAGSVTALENATRLYLLPVGVFGVALSTVIFTTLAKKTAAKDYDACADIIKKGLNMLFFLVIPSMAVLTIYAKDVVRLTLGYGKFDEKAIAITGGVLLFYSLGLYFYTGVHLMSRAFYSMCDSKMPMIFSVISICVNIALNGLLIGTMKSSGLALATAISSGVNFCCLIYFFRKKYIKFSCVSNMKFALKVLISTGIAVVASLYVPHIILKFVVFGIVYMGIWAKPLITRKIGVF